MTRINRLEVNGSDLKELLLETSSPIDYIKKTSNPAGVWRHAQ
jgi:hypothetical protein